MRRGIPFLLVLVLSHASAHAAPERLAGRTVAADQPAHRRGRPRFTPYFVGGQLSGEAPAEPPTRAQIPAAELARLDLERLEGLLARDGSRPELWTRKGELLAAASRAGEARRAFEEALRLDAHHRPARVGLGTLLVESGRDGPRGQELLESALTGGPRDAEPLVALARYALRHRDVDTARALLRRALEARPRHVDALYELGLLELREGSPTRALHHLSRVVEERPRHVRAHISRAMVYARLGERARALDAYATAWHLLEGEGPAAREVREAMRELDPFSDPARMEVPLPARRPAPAPSRPAPAPTAVPPALATRTANAGATAAASPDAPAIDLTAPPAEPGGDAPRQETAREMPGAAGRLERMAGLYQRHGLYEEATGAYHALIARSPNSDRARRAHGAIQELRDLPRPDLDSRLVLLRSLAGFLEERRDRRGARQVLERILLLAPEDAATWKDLAYLSARGGDLDEAVSLAGRALELAPGYHEALLVQGYALGRQRKFARALVLYRSVLESEPTERAREYAEAMERTLRVFADGP